MFWCRDIRSGVCIDEGRVHTLPRRPHYGDAFRRVLTQRDVATVLPRDTAAVLLNHDRIRLKPLPQAPRPYDETEYTRWRNNRGMRRHTMGRRLYDETMRSFLYSIASPWVEGMSQSSRTAEEAAPCPPATRLTILLALRPDANGSRSRPSCDRRSRVGLTLKLRRGGEG